MSPPEQLSPQEFSERSGLGLKSVYRRLHDGTLPHVQLGGRRHRILIPADALTLVRPTKATGSRVEPVAIKPAPKPGRKPGWLGDRPK